MYQGSGAAQSGPGVVSGALVLDGSGSITAGKPLDLEADHPFSYGCWFRYDAPVPMVLISTRDGKKGFRGFDLSLEPGHQLRAQIAGEDPAMPDAQRKEAYTSFQMTAIATTNVNPATSPGWHHVMAAYDGSTAARGIKIYVDGQPQPLSVLDHNFKETIKSDAPLYIGSRHGIYRFKGMLEDVRVYSRQISAGEAASLYATGVESLVRRAASEPTPQDRQAVADIYRRQDRPLQEATASLAAAQSSLRQLQPVVPAGWYVNGQGQTMVVIPGPVEFDMGSPAGEEDRHANETLHRVRIGRTFAIASKPVKVARYLQSSGAAANQPVGGAPDLPATSVSWYDAAGYCNWLSKQEGISPDQWCYEGEAQSLTAKKNFLALSGYRLPTEAEMEYATRAGASTTRYYGQTAELLPEYAWYSADSQSSATPSGLKKPNDFGLFDVHGDVWCWCQDVYQEYASGTGAGAADDVGGPRRAAAVCCGAARSTMLRRNVRSAQRGDLEPANRHVLNGFRLARTLPLVSLTPLPPAEGAENEPGSCYGYVWYEVPKSGMSGGVKF